MEKERKVGPREFFEKWPLYRRTQRYEGWSTPDTISRQCPSCGKETTWKLDVDTYVHPSNDLYVTEYTCQLCSLHRVSFVTHRVKYTDGNYYIQKTGQLPPHSINIPAKVERRLGSAADFYKKGLMCRNQGFGVGALSYFRRVIEDKTNDLIDTLADLAEARGIDQSTVSVIRAAKSQRTYDQRLEAAAPAIPESLRPGGWNPLATLHTLLSKGIHGRTEEECLQTADDVKEVFDHVIATLREEVEAQTRFVSKMGELERKRAGQK